MARVTINTTPTPIQPAGQKFSGASILLRCPTADIWVDTDPAVTTGTGYLLPAGQPLAAKVSTGQGLYAVASTAAVEAHLLKL